MLVPFLSRVPERNRGPSQALHGRRAVAVGGSSLRCDTPRAWNGDGGMEWDPTANPNDGQTPVPSDRLIVDWSLHVSRFGPDAKACAAR